jgi:CRISPR system Cascade subunit CasB
MSERDAIRSYVTHLYRLAHTIESGATGEPEQGPRSGAPTPYRLRPGEARSALARLRRGLGKQPGEAIEMLPLVVPYLPDGANRWEREAFFLVGALFAVHPTPSFERLTIGTVCRELGDHDSAEKRFMALLRCPVERLPVHLRQVVQHAGRRGVPINYYRLLHDLLLWNHPRRSVQRRWADDYWKTGN